VGKVSEQEFFSRVRSCKVCFDLLHIFLLCDSFCATFFFLSLCLVREFFSGNLHPLMKG